MLLLCMGISQPLRAQDTTKVRRDSTRLVLQPMTVEGRSDNLAGSATSASQGRVGIADLRMRPIAREGEVLEAIPGMILTQHSGGGKSNQMFVRGFNLDHGTDFNTRVEGMPINMPTHGHGQGYTDLNFLTPELVDHLEYKLGVYYPEIGDFGSAGGGHIRLASTLARPFVRVEAGGDRFARVVGGGSRRVGPGRLLVGGEAKRFDGPWSVPEDLGKWSGLARYTWNAGSSRFSVLAMAYRNRWNASDQIPLRAVTGGVINRFGQLDSTLGGRSHRHSIAADWMSIGAAGSVRISAFGVVSSLELYSNFTYFLDDPVRGDQIEQRDDRFVTGFDAEWLRYVRFAGRDHTVRVGIQTRYDEVDLALHRSTARVRFRTVRADMVGAWAAGVYVSAESSWSDAVRTVVGFRGDGQAFSVRGERLENSGTRTGGIVTPKATLVVSSGGESEFYVGVGSGFHSNDARGTTTTVDPATGAPADPVDPLVRSIGGEVGVRAAPIAGVRSTLALWWLELDSELRFVGDAGSTEAFGRSRRFGGTWANFWQVRPELSLDLDLALARARFIDEPDGVDYVPNALETVVGGGITWDPVGVGPSVVARLRHFGAHPLVSDNQYRGKATTLVNMRVGWIIRRIDASLSVLNVFDAREADIQYYYESRGAGEAEGIEGVHFHPVEPRQSRLGIAWAF